MNEKEQKQINAFYTSLVQRNAALIRWLCLRQSGGDKALCDDYTQEALLGLWLHLDSYRRELPEKVWVMWKVRTILYDYRRHRLPPPERLAFEVADSLAEEVCHARESLEELTAYLTDEERALVRQHLNGYTASEIANSQGTTANAIYKRMHKVLVKLRAINDKINNKQQ